MVHTFGSLIDRRRVRAQRRLRVARTRRTGRRLSVKFALKEPSAHSRSSWCAIIPAARARTCAQAVGTGRYIQRYAVDDRLDLVRSRTIRRRPEERRPGAQDRARRNHARLGSRKGPSISSSTISGRISEQFQGKGLRQIVSSPAPTTRMSVNLRDRSWRTGACVKGATRSTATRS